MRQLAYSAVAETLRKEIEAGAFPPDRRLPTDAELSKAYRVSRHTVRRAFAELVTEGLVYRVPGRGSFAVGSPGGEKYLRSVGSVDDLMALAIDTRMEVIEPLARAVDVAAAGRLRLESDDVAIGVFRRFHRNEPFSVTTVYLPPHLADRIASDPRVAVKGSSSSATIIGLLEEAGGAPLAGAYQSISATVATAELAEQICCSPGDPTLAIDRIYFDRRGHFVELAVSVFNVRRYSYRLELRRSIP